MLRHMQCICFYLIRSSPVKWRILPLSHKKSAILVFLGQISGGAKRL
jgi:hypothetical protein